MSIDLTPLAALFHRSYAVPLLACLYIERGAKFVTLVYRLGGSRDAVSMALKYLMHRGVVMRNTGYGHPLRPEYVLTPAGERLAAHCVTLVNAVERCGVSDVAFHKWSMPVVASIGQGASRFSAILDVLNGLTPRALTIALRELSARNIIDRVVAEGGSPRAYYALTGTGESLLPTLDILCVAATPPD